MFDENVDIKVTHVHVVQIHVDEHLKHIVQYSMYFWW